MRITECSILQKCQQSTKHMAKHTKIYQNTVKHKLKTYKKTFFLPKNARFLFCILTNTKFIL